MRQTTMAKPNEVVRQWYVVDGQGLTLGRLASEVAQRFCVESTNLLIHQMLTAVIMSS